MKKIILIAAAIVQLVVCAQPAVAQVISKPTLGFSGGNNPWYTGTTTSSIPDTTAYNTTDTVFAKFSEQNISTVTLQADVYRIGSTALTSASTVKIYASVGGVLYTLLQTSTMTNAAWQTFKLVVDKNPYTHYMIVISCADSAASTRTKCWFLARR